ncbi:MAG: hypothetical protein ACREDS_04195 [Limisphaerales bacterium]
MRRIKIIFQKSLVIPPLRIKLFLPNENWAQAGAGDKNSCVIAAPAGFFASADRQKDLRQKRLARRGVPSLFPSDKSQKHFL